MATLSSILLTLQSVKTLAANLTKTNGVFFHRHRSIPLRQPAANRARKPPPYCVCRSPSLSLVCTLLKPKQQQPTNQQQSWVDRVPSWQAVILMDLEVVRREEEKSFRFWKVLSQIGTEFFAFSGLVLAWSVFRCVLPASSASDCDPIPPGKRVPVLFFSCSKSKKAKK